MVVCTAQGEAIIIGGTVVEAGAAEEAAVEAGGAAEEGPEVPVPGANPLRPLVGCDPKLLLGRLVVGAEVGVAVAVLHEAVLDSVF